MAMLPSRGSVLEIGLFDRPTARKETEMQGSSCDIIISMSHILVSHPDLFFRSSRHIQPYKFTQDYAHIRIPNKETARSPRYVCKRLRFIFMFYIYFSFNALSQLLDRGLLGQPGAPCKSSAPDSTRRFFASKI